jgi:toxin ParE1/3/4
MGGRARRDPDRAAIPAAMKEPLRLAPEASKELREAAGWYEDQREGLGEAFIAAVEEALRRAAGRGPDCRPAIGVPLELGIKRVLVHRFPYLIVFIELPRSTRVLAVCHVRRRPGYWRKRLY